MTPDDDPEALYCRGDWMAFQRLIELLKRYESGVPLPRHPQPPGGMTYRTRDRKPWHDLAFAVRRRTGRLQLPHRPASEWPPCPATGAAVGGP